MEEKYEEGVERGMNLGREEGFTVARDGFRRALASKKANSIDTGTQTDTTVTTTSTSSQTDSTTAVSSKIQTTTTSTTTGTQTSPLGPLATVFSATSRFVQIDSEDTQKIPSTKTTIVSEQTTPQTTPTCPSSSPVTATSPLSLPAQPLSRSLTTTAYSFTQKFDCFVTLLTLGNVNIYFVEPLLESSVE